jgi:hypothetical protein
MPLIGNLQPREDDWTIRVEQSPSLLMQSLLWPTARRRAYHEVAVQVAFYAVTAIQMGALHRRRENLQLLQGDVGFFFRQIRDQHNTVHVTIFALRFNDNGDDHDPKGTRPRPRPFDPLVLNISGCVKGRTAAVPAHGQKKSSETNIHAI